MRERSENTKKNLERKIHGWRAGRIGNVREAKLVVRTTDSWWPRRVYNWPNEERTGEDISKENRRIIQWKTGNWLEKEKGVKDIFQGINNKEVGKAGVTKVIRENIGKGIDWYRTIWAWTANIIIDQFVGEYHAACDPWGTISPRSTRFNYRSHRRVNCIKKVNRASHFKFGDSVRIRSQGGKQRMAKWHVSRAID